MAAENELDSQGREAQPGPGTKEDSTTGQAPTTNLDDDPRFREWKSNTDRRISQLAAQAERERQQRQNIEKQWEQQYVATLSEIDKEKYLRQQAEEARDNLQRQMQDERDAIQKIRVLDEVSRLEGVPMEVIQGANDVMEAWRMAKQYKVNQPGNQQQTQQQQPGATMGQFYQPTPPPVDMGGGRRPASPVSDLQRQYDDAYKNYDMSAMLDIMAEADKQGVIIDEY